MNVDKVSVNRNVASLRFRYLTEDIMGEDAQTVFRPRRVLLNVTCSIYH